MSNNSLMCVISNRAIALYKYLAQYRICFETYLNVVVIIGN